MLAYVGLHFELRILGTSLGDWKSGFQPWVRCLSILSQSNLVSILV